MDWLYDIWRGVELILRVINTNILNLVNRKLYKLVYSIFYVRNWLIYILYYLRNNDLADLSILLITCMTRIDESFTTSICVESSMKVESGSHKVESTMEILSKKEF